MEAEALPAHARSLGARAMARLDELAASHPQLSVRGLGLMIGIEVCDAEQRTPRPDLTAAIQASALREGVMVIASGPEANVIRILPPLVITDDELELALDVLERATLGVLDAAG